MKKSAGDVSPFNSIRSKCSKQMTTTNPVILQIYYKSLLPYRAKNQQFFAQIARNIAQISSNFYDHDIMLDTNCHYIYFRLPIEQIAYVRFIVESYENLAQVTSIPGRGEMEWVIPSGLIDTAHELAQALSEETGMVVIHRPADWPE